MYLYQDAMCNEIEVKQTYTVKRKEKGKLQHKFYQDDTNAMSFIHHNQVWPITVCHLKFEMNLLTCCAFRCYC